MSIEIILASLKNLEKMHKSLLSLAYDKTEIIKNGDMDALDQILKDEQAHLAAIAQMDAHRQNAVKDYLTSKGKRISQAPTVIDVLEVTSKEEGRRLEEARDRLLHAIHDLKWQNDLNQKLTYQSLQFVNLSLDMVRPQPESVNYTKTEIQGQAKSKKQINFDSQV